MARMLPLILLLLPIVLTGCNPPEDKSTLGTHVLTIIDTSGKKPAGGTSGTYVDDVSGTKAGSFESANGRYKITLVNEVLTINGDKYTLKNPSDEIRIVDDRVEINGVEAHPDTK
ncbi:hypothetical protein GC197_14715 [bacterium]|nr:hypothetical protein [bacterium]